MLENFKRKHEMLRHGLEDNIKMYLWCIVCESGSPQISSQLSGFCGQGDESSNVANTACIFFTDRMVVSGCQSTHLWSCTENGLPLLLAAFRERSQ
jgi:hypothetical protein